MKGLFCMAWLLLLLLLLPLPACTQEGESRGKASTVGASSRTVAEAPVTGGLTEEEKAFLFEAAREAWRLVDGNYQPSTGLISATPHYHHATTWDIGSGLAAMFSARELGLLEAAEYEKRMRRTLQTLKELELFGNVAYNKTYSTKTARMSGREDRPTENQGHGWSATDLGRLLIWLKIIAENHPQFAADAEAVARRIKFDRVIANGYLFGEDRGGRGGKLRRFQEGRLGYEQYAAAGFALWGHAPERALDPRLNYRPLKVLGKPLAGDKRGMECLLSEPFVMLGLELGWTPRAREMAEQVLAVQEERYRQTGTVTIVSEDAVNRPPYYFYYYCIHRDGQDFVVKAPVPTKPLDEPRWVSTKSTFGWHVLLPSDYTRVAMEKIRPARSANGWHSGVMEKSQETTGTRDLNTAAVILESALYATKGGPLVGSR